MTAAEFNSNNNKNKVIDAPSNNGNSNDRSSSSKITNNSSNNNAGIAGAGGGTGTMTRMHPSMKRPRAPIACFRCHHKKVRCDGAHPNCTRCLSTGVLCAYPTSRRARNNHPPNVDPFIDNLSHLEARIRRIETDLESQRNMMQSICKRNSTATSKKSSAATASDLASQMRKTEQEVLESRAILAQLRLRGEQRIARGKRAASAANNATATSTSENSNNNNNSSNSSSLFNHQFHSAKRPCSRRTSEPNVRTFEEQQQQHQQHTTPIPTSANGSSPFYYPGPAATDAATAAAAAAAASFMYRPFDAADWSIFNSLPHTPVPDASAAATDANCTLMEYDSMLAPHPMDPVAKQSIMQQQQQGTSIVPPLLTVTAGDVPTPILRPSSSIDSSSSSSSSTQVPPNTTSDTFMPQFMLDDLEANSADLQAVALNNEHHSAGLTDMTTAAAAAAAAATTGAATTTTTTASNATASTTSTVTAPAVWYC